MALNHLFDKFRHDRKWVYLVLILCLAAVVLLRISSIANKTTIGHDESISYLSATCHEVSYNSGPVAYPVQVIKWKEYLQVDQRFCFRQISEDLAATDRIGDRPERKAHRSLMTTLWHIRRCLPDESYILSNAPTAQYDPQANVWLDKELFESLVSGEETGKFGSGRGIMQGQFSRWIL